MDNFNLDESMDLAEAYVGPMTDAIYRRLIEHESDEVEKRGSLRE